MIAHTLPARPGPQVGGLLMVWDNCGPHNTKAVADMCAKWGIIVKALLPNCTAELQVGGRPCRNTISIL